MKNLKTLVLTIFTVIAFNGFSQIVFSIAIKAASGGTVTCKVGDIIQFNNDASQDVVFRLNMDGSTVITIAAGTIHNHTVTAIDSVWEAHKVINTNPPYWGKIVITNTVVAGIKQLNDTDAAFKIFPNPTTKLLNVNIKTETAKLEMFNVNGQLVMSKEDLSQGDNEIDIENLTSGVYIARIDNAKIRIVKE